VETIHDPLGLLGHKWRIASETVCLFAPSQKKWLSAPVSMRRIAQFDIEARHTVV